MAPQYKFEQTSGQVFSCCCIPSVRWTDTRGENNWRIVCNLLSRKR